MSVKISQVVTKSSNIYDSQIRKTNNGMRNIFVQFKGKKGAKREIRENIK